MPEPTSHAEMIAALHRVVNRLEDAADTPNSSRFAPKPAMSEDSMPSKRMVPAQQLSDAGEDLVRLAAAKDALKAELDAAIATLDDEEAAHQDTLRLWQCAKAEIAALQESVDILTDRLEELVAFTEQRDELIAERHSFRNGWTQAHNRAAALTKERDRVTEQRDRVMKVVEAARRIFPQGGSFDYDIGINTLEALRETIAALDAEAAAETAPSLPETP